MIGEARAIDRMAAAQYYKDDGRPSEFSDSGNEDSANGQLRRRDDNTRGSRGRGKQKAAMRDLQEMKKRKQMTRGAEKATQGQICGLKKPDAPDCVNLRCDGNYFVN